MPASTILLILLAAVLAATLAGFQYLFRSRAGVSRAWILAALRFISLFAIFILLINPEIKSTDYYIEKPNLIIAIDNSASIRHLGGGDEIADLVKRISENEEVRERFEIKAFIFDRDLEPGAEPDFSGSQTNTPAALRTLEQLFKGEKAPTVLITDGNQTLGEDVIFSAGRYSNQIFPVIAGDTTTYSDLSVGRINVNKYAYLDNRFPVEMFLNYNGQEEVTSRVRITAGGNTIFSREVTFSGSDNSKVVEALLPASQIGTTTYSVELAPMEGEQNTTNNSRNFAVEVIDERTSVLLLSDLLHPDLGTLKKSIESNRQREVNLHQVSEGEINSDAFQLVILYQPNANFQNLISELQEKGKNYWIITGPETDYAFLNRVQDDFNVELTGQTEEYFPVVNENFNAYQFGQLDFSSFPPLQGAFGEIESSSGAVPLLFRETRGVTSETPLMALVENTDQKKAFLFGADLWKWRSHIFVEENSFQNFDDFIGKLVQYLAAGERKQRLSVTYEPLYQEEENIIITAEYFDRNYQFDPSGNLSLQVTNSESEETRQIPMVMKGRYYEADLGNFPEGEYSFRLTVAGEDLSRTGNFTLIGFDVEQQFTGANLQGMQRLASEVGSRLYFPDDQEQLIEDLILNKNLIPVQKSREKDVSLVDWYYLLFLIAAALAAEWFLRKYYGLI